MTSPLPPFDINIPEIITPTGQPAYLDPYRGTYRTDITPRYAQRLQRGWRQGLTRQQARRGPQAAPPPGLSERQWGILRRYIRQINERSSPASQITPQMITDMLDNGWGFNEVEQRLDEKLNDMIAFQDYGDPGPGRYHWDMEMIDREQAPWIEFWYYH